MKKHIHKRIGARAISIVLILAMLFSGTEITAFATEANTVETVLSSEDNDDNNGQTEVPDSTNSAEYPDETDESGEIRTPDENDESSDKKNPDEDANTDDMKDDGDTNDSDDKTDKSGETENEEELDNAGDTEEESPEAGDENANKGLSSQSISVERNNMSIEASSGLGSLLLEDIQSAAKENEDEAGAEYAISEIEVTGTTASVRLHAVDFCTVVVGIYEEGSGKAYAFGTADVQVGDSLVTVSIETESMPDYFVVKGYIVDTVSLRPLSEEYFTNVYTKTMQDFLQKTTNDFDSDKVVNLDEDKNTNFAVVKDGSALIKPEMVNDANPDSRIVNELVNYDEATNTYTFANVDENITNLNAEDVFVYQFDDNDIVVIKIKNIIQRETEDGINVVDITAYTDELNVDDVFEYVKIEDEVGTVDTNKVDPNSCPAGVEYLGRDTGLGYSRAVEGDPSISLHADTWKLDLDEAKKASIGPVTGTFGGNVTARLGVTITLKYYFSWNVWDVDLSVKSDAGVSGELKVEGKLEVPLCATLTIENKLITLKYTPTFVIDLSFEGKFEISANATIGMRVGNKEKNGIYNECEIKFLELTAKFDGYVGIDFNPTIDVKGIFHAGLDDFGLHLGVEASISGGLTDSVSTKEEYGTHDCGTECLSGNFYLKVPFDCKLKILKFKEYNLEEKFELDGGLLDLKFGKFYYSCKYNEFGWGTCPHKAYKIEVIVKSSKLNVANVSVNSDAGNETVLTNNNGKATLWLSGGRHMIYASYNGKGGSKSIEVDGAKSVTVILGVYDSAGADTVVQVDLSNNCSAALKKDGSLYLWGYNYSGQLGTGGTDNKNSPNKIALDNVKEIYLNKSNDYNAAALTTDGRLYTWGDNSTGELGNGTTDNTYIPAKSILGNVKTFCMGKSIGGAVTKDGKLYMWGGSSRDGASIGDGTNTGHLEPVEIIFENESIIDIQISGNSYDGNANCPCHCAAITKNGHLYMWGANYYGQLGDGTTINRNIPVRILENETVRKVYVENDNNCSAAITGAGQLYMWGYNDYGQLGNGTISKQTIPVKILEGIKIKDFVFGGARAVSAAIAENGSLYVWGCNDWGQLGLGDTDNRTVPVQLKTLGKVKSVSIGTIHSAAITEDGSLWMWGTNKYGQLGNGNTETQLTPMKIMENVSKVCLSDGYTAAIKEDGSLWMWGVNRNGQLGNGTTSSYYEPTTTPQRVNFPVNTKSTASYSIETDSTSEFAESSYAFETAALSTAEASPIVTPDTDNPARQTAVFSGLRASEVYNIYVMKSKDTIDRLSSDNLLYITQAVSGADGNMSVTYEMKEAFGKPVVFCVGMTQTDLSTAQISVPNITYDGEEHVVEASVVLNGQTLTPGTDYEIYGDCVVTEIGEYKVVIKGCGLYSGEKEVTFHVNDGDNNGDDDNKGDGDNNGDDDNKEDNESGNGDVLDKDIPSDNNIPEGLWIAGIADSGYDYTGSALKPEVRVYDNKTLLKEKRDYTISYKNNTKANDTSTEATAPTITVTGKGNYSGKETVTFKILPLDISKDTFYADDIALLSTGKAQTPVPKLCWGTKTLKKNTDYTVTYYDSTGTNILTNVKDAGNYYIELAGKGNFTGTRRINLKLTSDSKLMSKASVAKIADKPYTGEAVTPDITVKYGKSTLTAGTDYEVSYTNNVDIGIAYAILTGKGEYSGTKRVTFKITGPSISKASLTKPEDQIYGGVELKPAMQLSVNVNGSTRNLTEDNDYTVTWSNNQNVGTATAIFTGKGGFNGTLKKTFKIKPFNITTNTDNRFSANIENDTVPYAKGGAKPHLTVTFKKNDGKIQKLTEGTDYTVTYKNNTSLNDGSNTAKAPTAIIKGKGNFTGTKTVYYKVTTQDISALTLTAADKNYQNKKNIFSTKVTITDLDGKTLKAGKDYLKAVTYAYTEDTTLDNGTVRPAGAAVNTEDIIPAGTLITVTATAATNGNYTGTVSGSYRITQSNISSAKITIPNQTYTGKPVTLDESQITVKIKGTQLRTDQYQIVAGSYRNNIKKGTASVTIKGLDNYGGTKTVKYKITAKGFLWWWR